MSRPILIALDQQAPQAWRNGGGITRELFAWPAGPLWRWRVSVADITQDGPFSAYEGIDRWFAVIQGAGVRLGLPGASPLPLHRDSAPLSFDGAEAPNCSLIDGATRDLNLMSRRDAGRSTLQRAAAGQVWRSGAALRALFSTEAVSLRIDGQAPLAMPAGTLAVSPQAAHQRWQLQTVGAPWQVGDTPLQAWWLDFQASTPGGRP